MAARGYRGWVQGFRMMFSSFCSGVQADIGLGEAEHARDYERLPINTCRPHKSLQAGEFHDREKGCSAMP